MCARDESAASLSSLSVIFSPQLVFAFVGVCCARALHAHTHRRADPFLVGEQQLLFFGGAPTTPRARARARAIRARNARCVCKSRFGCCC